jgi:hypothetical protein
VEAAGKAEVEQLRVGLADLRAYYEEEVDRLHRQGWHFSQRHFAAKKQLMIASVVHVTNLTPGVGTFHVIWQSKHRLMLPSMIAVTNLTPGSGVTTLCTGR